MLNKHIEIVYSAHIANISIHVPCRLEYHPSKKFDLNNLFQFQVGLSRLSLSLSKLTSGKSNAADII